MSGTSVLWSRAVLFVVAVLWSGHGATASVGFADCTNHFVGNDSEFAHQPRNAVSICRDGYLAIAYDADMVNPAWVAVRVTPADVHNTIPGRKSFYADPDLRALGVAQAPVSSDAFNATWNRGHLAASRLMSHSEASKKASYTMANVAPQEYYFNQRSWLALESDTFNWIHDNATLHVMIGVGYADRSHPDRSYNNIAVPSFFFEVLCDPVRGTSVGFLGANNHSGTGIERCRTVAEVEALYGGQLFPDDVCNTHVVDYALWWCPRPFPLPSEAPPSPEPGLPSTPQPPGSGPRAGEGWFKDHEPWSILVTTLVVAIVVVVVTSWFCRRNSVRSRPPPTETVDSDLLDTMQ